MTQQTKGPPDRLLKHLTCSTITDDEKKLLATQDVSKETIQPVGTTDNSQDSALALAEPLPRRWLKIATADPDRAGDVMRIAGAEYANFLLNPQLLWQHGTSGIALNTIGRIVEIRALPNALYALAEYATPELYDFAGLIFRMDEAGYLPANSIGFRAIEWEANDFGGTTFLRWELIECSKVELPMNPQAIDEAGDPLSLEEASLWLAGPN